MISPEILKLKIKISCNTEETLHVRTGNIYNDEEIEALGIPREELISLTEREAAGLQASRLDEVAVYQNRAERRAAERAERRRAKRRK